MGKALIYTYLMQDVDKTMFLAFLVRQTKAAEMMPF